jgi:hypothetical protein
VNYIAQLGIFRCNISLQGERIPAYAQDKAVFCP